MMCVNDVPITGDASSAEGDAGNSVKSTTSESGKNCRLLCNPQRLPKPKVPRVEKKPVTTEAKYIIRDYFAWQYMKREKYAREVRWIKK